MGIINFRNKHPYPNMVLVARSDRRIVFEYLLREGVIVVKKDAYLPAHQQITSVPNLHIQMIVKSLMSRKYLNQVYNWGWSYYFLTNAGVKFLIEELGLPADSKIVPATHTKKRAVIPNAPKEGKEGVEGEEATPAKEE